MAQLSLSEPSLFPHKDSVLFGARSAVRRPTLLHKRAAVSSFTSTLTPNPPPAPMDPLRPSGSSRPLYLHFSQSIQPGLKPRVTRRHSHNPTSERRTQVSPLGEPLSVVGKTCLPLCSPRRPSPTTAAPGPPRPHIHVFLPSEAEGEDSESADEGFMDELDIRMSSLKLQQGAPQTLAVHCNKKKLSSCAQ